MAEEVLDLTLDVSLYPLRDAYLPAIEAFIGSLKKDPQLKVEVNPLSTQISGSSARVFPLLQSAVEEHFPNLPQGVLVVKILKGRLLQA